MQLRDLNPLSLLHTYRMLPFIAFQHSAEGWIGLNFNRLFTPVPIIYPAAKSLNINTRLNTPVSHFIHQCAMTKGLGRVAPRGILLSLWVAKPIDRAIQAMANPFFRAADAWFKAPQLIGNNAFSIVVAALFTPLFFSAGVVESIGLISNGIFQLAVPYQMLYAILKGKESSKEFFDLRSEIVSKRMARNADPSRTHKMPVYSPIRMQIMRDEDHFGNRIMPVRSYGEIVRDSKGTPNRFDRAVHTTHKIISYLPLWPLNMALCLRPRVLFPALRRMAVC